MESIASLEGLLVAACLGCAMLPMVRLLPRRPSRWLAIAVVAVWSGAVVWGTASLQSPDRFAVAKAPENRPIEVQRIGQGYVSSRTCRSCHPQEHASWHGSFHRRMTELVTPEAVVADFDNVELQDDDHRYRLSRHGDEFWVEIEPLATAPETAPEPAVRKQLILRTGMHHQQVFWYSAEDHRNLSQLPFVWVVEAKRWAPFASVFLAPPAENHGGEAGKWNANCSGCHSTMPRSRTLPPYAGDTIVAEFGISCEACHGPGERHVDQHRQPQSRYALHLSAEGDPTIVNPARLDHRRSAEVCGQCHGLSVLFAKDKESWNEAGTRYRPGQELTDSRIVLGAGQPVEAEVNAGLLAEDRNYFRNRQWSDGMVRLSGREYAGLLKTACFQHGQMSCLSCHRMHPQPEDPRPLAEWANDQLDYRAERNQACLQCHETMRDNVPAHTHHAAGSAGSLCYNCHMPHTSYGLMKAIRSHTIDSPRVAATLATGRPNACNLCHLDRTLGWTADQLSQWYGQPRPRLAAEQEELSEGVLMLLRGDAGQRALLAWSMGWPAAQQAAGDDWLAPYLAQLLVDPYPTVRYIAARSLRGLPDYESLAYDHVGTLKHRLEWLEQVTNAWTARQRDKPPAPERPALLIDSAGRINQQRFLELLRERDDRRLDLKE